jgi:hypothetical protein
METPRALGALTDRGTMRTGLLVLFSLAIIGCAQFQHRPPAKLPFMDRSKTKTDGEVQVILI